MIEYKASLPDENVNVSKVHPLKEFTQLVLGLIAISLLVFYLLGFLVDLLITQIPPEAELKYLPSFLDKFDTVSDSTKDSSAEKSNTKLTEKWLQKQVDSLVACSELHVPIRVHLVESDDINAFALPGGHIIVLGGLLKNVNTVGGLDFVLAHELAHFKNRDHLRSMGRGLLLAVGLSVLVGTDSQVFELLNLGTGMEQSRYSRKRESAADVLAFRTLHCRYGHVGGSTELFTSLASKEKLPAILHWLGTHPDTKARIRELDALAKSLHFESRPSDSIASLNLRFLQNESSKSSK